MRKPGPGIHRVVVLVRGGLVEDVIAEHETDVLVMSFEHSGSSRDDLTDLGTTVFDANVNPKQVWEDFVNHGGADGMEPPAGT
jgi:hypothetical protein